MTLEIIAIFMFGVFVGWLSKIPIFLHLYKKWEVENKALKGSVKRYTDINLEENIEKAAEACWNAGFSEKDSYDSLSLHNQFIAQDMAKAAIESITGVSK